MNRLGAVLLASLSLAARLDAAGPRSSRVAAVPAAIALPSAGLKPASLPKGAAAAKGSAAALSGLEIAAAAVGSGAAQAAAAAVAAPAIHAIANGASAAQAAAAAQAPASAKEKAGDRTAAAQPTLKALGAQSASGEPSQISAAAAEAFDGQPQGSESQGNGRTLEPRFEPPTLKARAPLQPAARGQKGEDPDSRRLALSFPIAQVSGLMAIDRPKSVYGIIKRVRDFPASREYWGQFKKGAEIDVVSKGENVFGRTTKIVSGVTKTIGKLTRDDLRGVMPEFQLQAPIRQLRQFYLDQLEEARKTWNPNDPSVTLATTVRVVKFQSYLDLFREAHGPDAVPQVEKPAPRVPLKAKAEGKLKPLTMFLPRAVFLDVDALDGPISPELLSDMMKLQRTGVYFVAFSRKPYAAVGSLRDKLIRQMSAYQLSILMPIRFMAVTDNGAVISEFPKGGNVVPVDVNGFSPSALDILRDASVQAATDVGVSPFSLKELAQPPVKEAVDEFPGRHAFEKMRPSGGPQVRFEILVPPRMKPAKWDEWRAAFEKRLAAQGMKFKATLSVDEDGRKLFAVQKTDIPEAMPRLLEALGEKFGLYLNPSDILVLSDDAALKKANPHLDFGGLSGLKGSEMIENALGLILGEHRENVEGDLSGSASRMAQFSRDRTRYLSEFLIKQDGAEQNINFFSGHVVHAANDWLVYQLQNGGRPTPAEYEAELRRRWDKGIREFKPVGIPQGEDMEGWERESTKRGLNMYHMVLAAHDRKEILIGTEIPNFFMLKDRQRRTEKLKRRYTLHTIFDFIALRPDPNRPGHATLVIYDFKTGPAQSRQKLDKDLQVLTYALFAKLRWVGNMFQTPYLSGDQGYIIDAAKVEFIYGAIKQPTTVTAWDLETIQRRIVGILNRISASEKKLLGEAPAPKKKKPAAKAAAKGAASKASVARAARRVNP